MKNEHIENHGKSTVPCIDHLLKFLQFTPRLFHDQPPAPCGIQCRVEVSLTAVSAVPAVPTAPVRSILPGTPRSLDGRIIARNRSQSTVFFAVPRRKRSKRVIFRVLQVETMMLFR